MSLIPDASASIDTIHSHNRLLIFYYRNYNAIFFQHKTLSFFDDGAIPNRASNSPSRTNAKLTLRIPCEPMSHR